MEMTSRCKERLGREAGVTLPETLAALVILAIVYMFNFVDRQILSILLPAIRDEFQVGDTVLGLLAGTAFAMFYVAMGIPIARIADRVNPRPLAITKSCTPTSPSSPG